MKSRPDPRFKISSVYNTRDLRRARRAQSILVCAYDCYHERTPWAFIFWTHAAFNEVIIVVPWRQYTSPTHTTFRPYEKNKRKRSPQTQTTKHLNVQTFLSCKSSTTMSRETNSCLRAVHQTELCTPTFLFFRPARGRFAKRRLKCGTKTRSCE